MIFLFFSAQLFLSLAYRSLYLSHCLNKPNKYVLFLQRVSSSWVLIWSLFILCIRNTLHYTWDLRGLSHKSFVLFTKILIFSFHFITRKNLYSSIKNVLSGVLRNTRIKFLDRKQKNRSLWHVQGFPTCAIGAASKV